MDDQNSEKEAQSIIEELCPEQVTRFTVLSMMAEAIKEANLYGRDKWAVSVGEKARLIVGHYYICTLTNAGVWIALDDRFKSDSLYSPSMKQLNAWGWQEDEPGQAGAYPVYKDRSKRNAFSVNGHYTIQPNHAEVWPHIRRQFFNFIYKAVFYGQQMDHRSPSQHSPGMLKYMRHTLGVALPDPLYTLFCYRMPVGLLPVRNERFTIVKL